MFFSVLPLGLDRELLRVQHVIPTGKQLPHTPQLALSNRLRSGEPAGTVSLLVSSVRILEELL
jgi:hypothetical protein